MNSFLNNATQSFSLGGKKGRGKPAPVQKYSAKVACSYCKRAQREKPPRWWSQARARREAGEWCRRDVMDDTTPGQTVQAVQKLTLCPLHEEDLIEAEPNWLDASMLLLKSKVWASCREADSQRAAAQERDGCRRCFSALSTGVSRLTSLPDELPSFIPGWVQPLLSLLALVLALILAPRAGSTAAEDYLRARQLSAASGFSPSGSSSVQHRSSYPCDKVTALAVHLDHGHVHLMPAASGSCEFGVRVRVPQAAAAAATQVENWVLPEVVLRHDGVLTVARAASVGSEATASAALLPFALARALTVEVQLPLDLPRAAQHNLTVDVVVGALPDGGSAAAAAAAVPIALLPRADHIEWEAGLGALWLGHASLRTAEGTVRASALHARRVWAASARPGAWLELSEVVAHEASISAGAGSTVRVEGLTLTSSLPWRGDDDGGGGYAAGGGALTLRSGGGQRAEVRGPLRPCVRPFGLGFPDSACLFLSRNIEAAQRPRCASRWRRITMPPRVRRGPLRWAATTAPCLAPEGPGASRQRRWCGSSAVRETVASH
jgi:hypothetical protein